MNQQIRAIFNKHGAPAQFIGFSMSGDSDGSLVCVIDYRCPDGSVSALRGRLPAGSAGDEAALADFARAAGQEAIPIAIARGSRHV